MADFRAIPSIDQLLRHPGTVPLVARHGHDATTAALRAAVAALRTALAAHEATPIDVPAGLVAAAAGQLEARARGSLRRVVNATGVVIHTNLGRAPLGRAALDRVQAVAGGYATLEYDLAAGRRGSRSVHAEATLSALTGAEAAAVVNNNAAAMMLVLAATACGSGETEEKPDDTGPDPVPESSYKLDPAPTRTKPGEYTCNGCPDTDIASFELSAGAVTWSRRAGNASVVTTVRCGVPSDGTATGRASDSSAATSGGGGLASGAPALPRRFTCR